MRDGAGGAGTPAGSDSETAGGNVLERITDTRARVVDDRYVGTYRRHVNNLT